MDLILWMLFGAISAWIAGIVLGRDELVQYVFVGVVGAVAAGLAVQRLVGAVNSGVNYLSLIVSIAGALGLVWVVVLLTTQQHDR